MNTATTTPPVILKTLFPLKANRHKVDSLAAKGHRIFVFGESILFEGTPSETSDMKTVLVGGVTA